MRQRKVERWQSARRRPPALVITFSGQATLPSCSGRCQLSMTIWHRIILARSQTNKINVALIVAGSR